MALVHSNNEPGVPTQLTTNINVRFVSYFPLQLQIKKPNPMKALTPIQNKRIIPSPFQIAAHLEDYVHYPHAPGLKKPAPALSQTPFADSTVHSEKPKKALKSAERRLYRIGKISARHNAVQGRRPVQPHLAGTGTIRVLFRPGRPTV
jgi:hypothetical protein